MQRGEQRKKNQSMLWGVIDGDIKCSKQAIKKEMKEFFYLLKHINVCTSQSYSSYYKVALGQATSQINRGPSKDKNIDTLLLP